MYKLDKKCGVELKLFYLTTRQKDAIIIKLSGERKAPQASGALLRGHQKISRKGLDKSQKK